MRELIALYILVVSATLTTADVCSKCNCNEKQIDCISSSLEDHFNDSDWNGTTQTVALFDHNNIIHLKAFPKLPLTKLSLTHNQIIRIDPACFKELVNITELDLSNNLLTSEQLTPNVFQGHYAPEAYEPLRNLKVLKLNANALHTLDADLFEHTPNLEELILASNPLRIIDRQTMIALTSISYLKIYFSSTKYFRHNVSAGNIGLRVPSSKLRQANLFTTPYLSVWDPFVRIVDIANGLCERLDFFTDYENFARQVLDLSSTSLRSFPEHLLHTPRFLETLYLSSNLFSTPPQALEDSHHLKNLYLNENPIATIMSFPRLPYLEILSLSWMPNLTHIGPGALSGLVSLQEFYCSHNPQLSTINASAFSQPAVGAPSGQTWPHIKKIALNNNQLGYLDFELLGHWDQVEMVNIQNNPWVCECHNQWMVSTLLPLLEGLNSSENNIAGIVCHEPEAMRGQSLADLDHRSYHMRCLDLYGRHPERDGSFLVGTLIGVIFAVPLTILLYVTYRRHLQTTAAQYHRAFYKRGDSLHEFAANPAL